MNTKDFMAAAIEEARKGMLKGAGGPFGSVVVKDGKIIGRSSNKVFETNDPTAHAEIMAIRDAAQYLGSAELKSCIIYSLGEPCPMCMGAIYWSGIEKLYFANTREEAEAIGFRDTVIYKELSLPAHQRTIPGIHIPSDEAGRLFSEWNDCTDKQDLPQT